MNRTFVRVSLFLFILSISQYLVLDRSYAATMSVDETLSNTTSVNVPEAVKIPNEDLLLSGFGEPGADVTLTALNNGQVIFTKDTTVDNTGKWQLIIPGFVNPFPDQFLIGTKNEVSYVDIVESTTVTAAAATASFVAAQIIFEQLFRLLQVIGLLGRRTSRGFVYDFETKRPVSFALVTIKSVLGTGKENATPLQETVVSNENGLLRTVNLPPGTYKLNVAHPDYAFPLSSGKPWYVSPIDFYQGETIELSKQDKLDVLLIPLKPLKKNAKSFSHWLKIRVIVSFIRRGLQLLSIPIGAVSIILVVLYPSFINFSLASFYLIIGGYEVYKIWQKPIISGSVRDDKGKPISEATVRVVSTPDEELATVMTTDQHGNFKTRLKKAKYRIIVGKEGLVLTGNNTKTFTEVLLQKNQTGLEYIMQKPGEFDWTAI